MIISDSNRRKYLESLYLDKKASKKVIKYLKQCDRKDKWLRFIKKLGYKEKLKESIKFEEVKLEDIRRYFK